MEPRILMAGDAALVVEFGDQVDPALNLEVRELWRAVERAAIPGVTELVPTYRSLLVCYDPLAAEVNDLRDRLLQVDRHKGELGLGVPRVIRVPTAYGGEFGPDLSFVARHSGLTEAEVVEIHAGAEYLVYMIGFSPGFPYLGGMSPRIATPRLPTPRTVIPAGSVGIAQQQTGIYPVESPGGWQLIGRTPLRLFDAARLPPALFEAGDSIRFVPMSAEEFREIEGRQ
jgi:KipI family sensor histidine kinase inhibitor